MKIKIKAIYLQNEDYKIFEPKQNGEVELKKLAEIWKMSEENAENQVRNHPSFVVEEAQNEVKKSK